jgi:hypothetical protein
VLRTEDGGVRGDQGQRFEIQLEGQLHTDQVELGFNVCVVPSATVTIATIFERRVNRTRYNKCVT